MNTIALQVGAHNCGDHEEWGVGWLKTFCSFSKTVQSLATAWVFSRHWRCDITSYGLYDAWGVCGSHGRGHVMAESGVIVVGRGNLWLLCSFSARISWYMLYDEVFKIEIILIIQFITPFDVFDVVFDGQKWPQSFLERSHLWQKLNFWRE